WLMYVVDVTMYMLTLVYLCCFSCRIILVVMSFLFFLLFDFLFFFYFFFFFFFFFFSSRRRHTRFDCDWSSDVCSSDLCEAAARGPLERSEKTLAALVAITRVRTPRAVNLRFPE